MEKSDSTETVFFNRPAGLARMLALDDAAGDLWSPAEMRVMWQHQLSTPVGVDLGVGAASDSGEPDNSSDLKLFLGKSFGELLTGLHPPLALLKQVKDFAKGTFRSGEDAQLRSVGAALYYAAYAAGIVRCQQRLGGMRDGELKRGFKWALSLDWLDEPSRKLIGQASDSLVAEP